MARYVFKANDEDIGERQREEKKNDVWVCIVHQGSRDESCLAGDIDPNLIIVLCAGVCDL